MQSAKTYKQRVFVFTRHPDLGATESHVCIFCKDVFKHLARKQRVAQITSTREDQMKFRAYIPAMLLVLTGTIGSVQQAHAETPPILLDDLSRVINGIELNYQRPFLWIRYTSAATPNDTAPTRHCYKMDTRQRPNKTYGWVSTYNYALNGWTQAYGVMTDADTAWCWQ
jgi:hypothetical protein